MWIAHDCVTEQAGKPDRNSRQAVAGAAGQCTRRIDQERSKMHRHLARTPIDKSDGAGANATVGFALDPFRYDAAPEDFVIGNRRIIDANGHGNLFARPGLVAEEPRR